MSTWRERVLDRGVLWRAAVAVAAAIGLYFGVDAWIGDRSIVHVDWLGTWTAAWVSFA